jgi:thiosulfate dehydrogenase [quinone] large subunit
MTAVRPCPDRDGPGALAHGLLRICLGANIFLHGATRIGGFDAFAAHLHKQFEPTFLPSALISASAYLIVAGETVVGALLLLGLGVRKTLVAGLLLMLFLQVGTCLIQDWNVATQQLTYILFYGLLLAAADWDGWSLDRWRRRSSLPSENPDAAV